MYSPDAMSNATHSSLLSMDWANLEQFASLNPFMGTIDVFKEEFQWSTKPFQCQYITRVEFDTIYDNNSAYCM